MKEGLSVAVLARREETVAEAARAVEAAGGSALPLRVDAGDPAALARALAVAIDRLGPPSCVVFNAVALPPGGPLEVDPDALLQSLAVNAVAPFVVARTCAPHMAAGSSLLITGGGIVFAPAPELTALSLGKVAGRTATALLAGVLAERGIHAATVLVAGQVAPGTRFDPDAIAGELWRLHTQPQDEWEHETTWR